MKEKIFESILGMFFLIPAIVCVVCFMVNLCSEGKMCDLRSLSGLWDCYGFSFVFVGIMALVGAYMLKNSSRYVFHWLSIREADKRNILQSEQQRINYLNRYK